MTCPRCGEDDPRQVVTGCPDPTEPPGMFLTFTVCGNCDHGINDHTEGQCDCPCVLSVEQVEGLLSAVREANRQRDVCLALAREAMETCQALVAVVQTLAGSSKVVPIPGSKDRL